MTGSSDLRSRIGENVVVSVTDDEGEFAVVVDFDGIDVEHSILASREEAIEVAICGLRIDWVCREIERVTATASDVRVALEGAPVLGWEGEETSDLQEAFMLLASDGELDAWREEKVRRLGDEMDLAEAVLVDAETVEVWSSIDPKVNGTTMIVERRAWS